MASVNDKPADDKDIVEPHCRRWQFSIGELLLLMTALAAYMATFGRALPVQGWRALVFIPLHFLFFLCLFAWLIGSWRIFVKAGLPGWGTLVPIYNLVLLARLAGWSSWEVIYLLIPGLNYIALIGVSIEIAHRFGKEASFGLGLFLVPTIFCPILGFGTAQYDPSRSELAKQQSAAPCG